MMDIQTKFSLAPSFVCPYGWPSQPNYPIDESSLIIIPTGPSSSSSTIRSPSQQDQILADDREKKSKTSELERGWTEIFSEEDDSTRLEEDSLPLIELNRNYLESIYLPQSYLKKPQSCLVQFAERVRSYSKRFDHTDLIELFESFLIPEDLLAKKWNEEVEKFLSDEKEDEDEEEEERREEEQEQMFHHHEVEAIELILGSLKNLHSVEDHESNLEQSKNVSELPATNSLIKPSFIKSNSLKQWIETWSTRETQLQIILLLEIIILTKQSSSDLHPKQLSSPRKGNNSQFDQPKELLRSEAIVDLELLLEGLVDRLAMWQVIGELDKEMSNLFSERKIDDSQTDDHELDDVQRFWTDVIEEYYTDHLSNLNRSFRPKLFPTSIDNSNLQSSSLLPTKFNSKPDEEDRMRSRIDRTPNLKKLEQRAMKARARTEEEQKMSKSPTLMKLKGMIEIDKKNGDRKMMIREKSRSESQIMKFYQTHHHYSSSKSLFNRREINMNRVISKPKLNLNHHHYFNQKNNFKHSQGGGGGGSDDDDDGNKDQKGVSGVWGQVNNRIPGQLQLKSAKRKKSSSPKKIEGWKDRTEVLMTPRRKTLKRSLTTNEVLVPDTPQTQRIA